MSGKKGMKTKKLLKSFLPYRGNAPNSLAWSLYNAIKQDSQYGSLSGTQKLRTVNQTLQRFLDVPELSLIHI